MKKSKVLCWIREPNLWRSPPLYHSTDPFDQKNKRRKENSKADQLIRGPDPWIGPRILITAVQVIVQLVASSQSLFDQFF